jgi:hypothetical protein
MFFWLNQVATIIHTDRWFSQNFGSKKQRNQFFVTKHTRFIYFGYPLDIFIESGILLYFLNFETSVTKSP